MHKRRGYSKVVHKIRWRTNGTSYVLVEVASISMILGDIVEEIDVELFGWRLSWQTTASSDERFQPE
jgi:hypothetical protein